MHYLSGSGGPLIAYLKCREVIERDTKWLSIYGKDM